MKRTIEIEYCELCLILGQHLVDSGVAEEGRCIMKIGAKIDNRRLKKIVVSWEPENE